MFKQWCSWLWERRVHLGLILLAVLVRLVCVPNRSIDYIGSLSSWSNFIIQHGGWAALKHDFANYTPPYLYWLVMSTKLEEWLPRLLTIKLFPMAVDFVCAYFIYQLVKLKFPSGQRATASFYAVLFTPTIPINSALWGQCDVLYTTGLIACLYFLCINRKHLAMLSFGIAFAFKIQAIFLSLFLLTLVLKRVVKLWHFIYIPLTYLIAIIPAWIIGRPLLELLLIYRGQVNDNDDLTRNAPNLYQWLPNQHYSIVMPIGVLLTAGIIVAISWVIYRRKVAIEPNFLVTLYTLSALVIPFFLPRMHDRYFYPADVGTILFAAYNPKYTWMPVVLQVASLIAYVNGDLKPLLKFCSIGIAIVIGYVILHLHQQFLAPVPGSKPLVTSDQASPFEA
jgi:Gpi18-like mannosyltransferase